MLQPFTEKSYFIYIKWQLCYNESAFCKASETQNVKILRRVEHLKEVKLEEAAYQFDGKMSLRQAIPLGLQHVCAMFVGNLTPLLIITSACGIAGGEFADLQVTLLQSAMFVAGVVTLVQLFTVGPVGGGVPIIMGTSSGFIGVFNSVVGSMGGGVLAYGAIMGASIIGGIFESVLGFFLKPLRKFFPPVVTGTVVLSIGLSLISVGINSFGGGNSAKDFGSVENLLLALFVLVVILIFKHWTTGFLSSSAILIGILAGYVAAFVMGFVLPTTGVTADGVEYTKAWVLNWDKVAQASWFAIPKLVPVKIVFDMRAILPVLIMFIVTAVETVGDISGVMEGGMNREPTDKELSGGVICDGLGTVRRAAQYLFQPECGSGGHDQGGQPHGPGLRCRVPDPVRPDPQAGRPDLHHAAGRSGRRSRDDVLVHRGQRHPAHHQGADDPPAPDHRVGGAGRGLRHGCQQRHPGQRSPGTAADLRRVRHRSGCLCGHPAERAAAQKRSGALILHQSGLQLR